MDARRSSLRLCLATASLALFAASCSSNEVPESLPMLEDAPSSAPADDGAADETDSTALDAPDELAVPGIGDAVAELTPEQQLALDACAVGLNAVASAADAESPTYTDDVVAALLDPASPAAVGCGPLLDPESGIDQGLMISFMIETLPPELLSTLGALMPNAGSDSIMDDAVGEATLEPADDAAIID